MIGSPDLLAFTGTEGFEEAEDEHLARRLPEELSVPLQRPGQPWSCSARFHRDFILVAEFCEQVGPKPVLTIPDDHSVIGSFDINHFSVRIMSVDYQASGPGHTPPSSHGPQLNFNEDSKVILGDSADDAFAYVQHVTLYDLEARGMVRPFCMAYVCSDQAKLMENFLELSTSFSQASDSLKTGNRQAFSMELQNKLQELESKRLLLLQNKELQESMCQITDVDDRSEELEAVEHSIFNHSDLLRQVTSYPNRKLNQPDFLPYDPAEALTDPISLIGPEPYLSSSIHTSSSSRSEHHLKSLHELCNTYFLSLMKKRLSDTERRLRGDRSILRTSRVIQSISRKLELTNFLFELWSPDDMEEEERGCVEVDTRLGSKQDTEASHSQTPALEFFFSCVEEIPIKLEPVEGRTATPEPNAETGSVSSGDSIEVLGTEKSYRTQHIIARSDSREMLGVMTDTCVKRPLVDAGVKRVRAYARRANSEDSIEVLSTTESIFPEDLKAITEEEAEQPLSTALDSEEEQLHTLGNSDLKQRNPSAADSLCEEENIEPVKEEEDEGLFHQEEVLKQSVSSTAGEEESTVLMEMNKVYKDNITETMLKPLHEEAVKSTASSELHQRLRSLPDLLMTFSPRLTLTESDHSAPPQPPLRLHSIDESSDCTSFTNSSDPSSLSLNTCSSPHSARRRRRRAALTALRFIKQNSFSQHALFCLLSGRPLVVIGGEKMSVRKLVDALSLFLPNPGPDRSAVMPFLATPLQLTDLITWRLMGIHRSQSSSSSSIVLSLTRYSRYLALLDLDQQTLCCPSYSGSLISKLVPPQSAISRGITYLLHLESCLTALANHVLLYTFNPALRRLNTNTVTSSGEDEPQCVRNVCSSESDWRVMHFLSDLIKERHVGRGPAVLRFSYSPVHQHRNTNPT
ncbi:guanine nucleotide exchange protein smcr8b isoform X2 [Gouania willdenowi]|uniref:guanine nucleotide exchange protein smcr8b isoform X2 n=1 Tax=Gouania willdenowi TaxID=441366 RepID=UPI0010557B70|nr:guanine nucleotide exchange protein smcr8a-like isoform X2 [Gouania willdenowi]